MKFRDHFSRQAATYARHRPHYPEPLFEYIAENSAARTMAWDCATGNGQAARGLLRYFDRVIATDASAEQIENAEKNAGIEYRVAAAEKSGLASHSVDTITVAQALHWFDLDPFYTEAARVLKPEGLLAVWCYDFLAVDPAIDAAVNRLYGEILSAYWPFERKIVEDRYQTIPFPFVELPAPTFSMEIEWSLPDLLGYIASWSAVQEYMAAKDADPIDLIRDELTSAWGTPERTRRVTWPLTMRAGRAKQ